MNPPPVTTSGVPNAGAYPPPPGPPALAAVPHPLGTDDVPFNQAAMPPAQVLLLDATTGRLPEGITLDQGREKCFGKFSATDHMCKECPHPIESQCRVQTPGVQVRGAEAVTDPELAKLQSQLEGSA